MNEDQQGPYQGLSRLHRPQTFGAVLGQDAIITTLKNALKKKQTAGAYLFTGTRGTGKTTLARVLAKALNCQGLTDEMEPCGSCLSCKEMEEGKNLNVIEIDGASNRGIDDIRQLNETAGYAPSHAGCKIFIIDEVHMLTKEAFNALLKTLEEPPKNVKFFLATTEAHKIPPTIISRCQRFDLRRISPEKILEKLSSMLNAKEISYEEEALYQIASLADGSMRVAESLLDQMLCLTEGGITKEIAAKSLATPSSQEFFAFDKAFSEQDLSFAFTFAEATFSSGKDLLHFLECLLEHYRNILSILLKVPMGGVPSSIKEGYSHSATLYTKEQTLYILDYLIERHQAAAKTAFKRVTLEMLLLHILRSKNRVSPAELVERLQKLKGTPVEKPAPKPIVQEVKAQPAPAPKPIVQEIKVEMQPKPTPTPPAAPKVEKGGPLTAGQETLIRFASVELEGTFTND